jgi:prolyl-tRNA editing enzyme YbaK/EbsC (Cys-tRNA(Pro) deacylase)
MESLEFKPVIDNPELVARAVFELAKSREDGKDILTAEIDPRFMGGVELCEHYGIDPNEGANCVVIEATKGGVSDFVAVIVPVGYRADLNGFVKKHLNARRVSLAPLDKVLELTGMEYGSITPFGLPQQWKILIDALLMSKEKIVVGGGKQISKLLVPTSILKKLPGVEIIEGLSKSI